ncbi:MAG: hypothetical protein HQL47_03690 [Gammaproteobacteria bacterium]|nr:hypothetical protein [Gammaproteobacteria bacterium]
MSDKGKQDDQRVRFGSNQILMPEAKRKLALADEAQDKLVQLTERYPDLATDYVQNMLKNAGPRKSAAGKAEAGVKKQAQPGLAELVAGLIGQMSVDEIIETLSRNHGIEVNSDDLMLAVGEDVYADMLRREAAEYRQNALSDEQIADLWNQSGINNLLGGRWDTWAVNQLLATKGAGEFKP